MKRVFSLLLLVVAVSRLNGEAPLDFRTARQYAEDILLSKEHGTNDFTCRRYADSPSVSCMTPPPGLEPVFDKAIQDINAALSPSRFELRRLLPNESSAQIKFHFVARPEYVRLSRQYGIQAGSRDFSFWEWWGPDGRMTRSVAFVLTDRASPDDLRYRSLRVLLGAMGYTGWADSTRDSIFSGARVTELSPADRRLIPFFYTHVKPGFRRFELQRAFDTYWEEWRK